MSLAPLRHQDGPTRTNILAQQQATERGAYEAIFVRDGMITEGSRSNVMGVLDGELRTHPANELILRGITRDVVLENSRCASGIRVGERAIPNDALGNVDELFLTGTGSGRDVGRSSG